MARCFDHGPTVMVQFTAEEANVRQRAEGVTVEEHWRVGKGPVKFWFRKDDSRLFSREIPNEGTHGEGWLVGYNLLIFRARDVAIERDWLPKSDYHGVTLKEIREGVAPEQAKMRAKREAEERAEAEKAQQRNEALQRKQQGQALPFSTKTPRELAEEAGRALGLGNWHDDPGKRFYLTRERRPIVAYTCGCVEHEDAAYPCIRHPRPAKIAT